MALKYDIFANFSEKEKRKVMSIIGAKELFYKKGQTITYALKNRYLIGIIVSGEANMIRYDYTGERTIVEEMVAGDIFSDMFVSNHASELAVIATKDANVIFISYDELIKKCETSQYALMILDNLFNVMSKKIIKRNERIELLTARSIRNKLLAYFELEAKKNNSKSFNLNYSYTDLADYLAIDRSAMMRELKNLKEDRLIKDVNKKITLLF